MIREAVIDERLEHYKDENVTATNAEAAGYLSTASMEGPLSHDWAEIYLHVAGLVIAKRGTPVPEDLKIAHLGDYRVGLLANLKRDIYNSRLKHRREMWKKSNEKEDR